MVKAVAVVVVLTLVAVKLAERLIDKVELPQFFHRMTTERKTKDTNTTVPSAAPEVSRLKKKSTAALDPPISTAVEEWSSLGPVSSTSVRKVPSIQELRPGMDRSQLTKLYGDPILRTTETHDRRLLERYIYADRDRHVITVAVLENGRIVRSEPGRYMDWQLIHPER
jgi:hypothetical protein